MNILDFIFFFIYVIIFSIIFSFRRKRYKNPLLRKYHKQAFWIKIISTFGFCIFVVYLSPGDTNGLYYPEGLNIAKLIMKDPSNIKLILGSGAEFDESLLNDIGNSGYFREESNFMVSRLVAIFSFFTFGKFMAINLVFSMISFTGVWRLFRFFYEQYPHLHKQFAIAILYLPTFVFWSSGILKDPICTGALGWVTYSLYSIFYTKNNVIKNLILVIFFGYFLVTLKIYILVAYVPFYALFLILKNVNLIKNPLVKVLLVIGFFVGSIFGFVKAASSIQGALSSYASQGITASIKNYQTNYENQSEFVQSNFSLGVEFDGSSGSLAKIAPAAMVATLFRPFIWESKKPSTLLSSLESLALMIFTLYVLRKVGILKFFKTIVKSPIVMYCFFYSLIFALFVGATTLNFGTLVRYKIPGIPFFIIALFLILEFNGKLKKSPEKVRAGLVSGV
ncbi:MAG: hypothetical protein ABIO04_13310 [Ferruginibacter sp.]